MPAGILQGTAESVLRGGRRRRQAVILKPTPTRATTLTHRTMKTEGSAPAEGGISKVKLALGAASLFFFVIGVKRSFRTDDGREIRGDSEERASTVEAARGCGG